MTSISEAGDVHLTNLCHCFCLCLSDLAWLGQNAVAGFKSSATACDLEHELRDSFISEAVVAVLQCLSDALTKRTLLKDQQLGTLALNRPSNPPPSRTDLAGFGFAVGWGSGRSG